MQNQHWLHHDLLTLQFWLLIILLIAPWIIWYKLIAKKRLCEILLFGMIVSIIATTLDEFGCQLNLWEYVYDIEPLFPRLIPVNFTVLPVSYMLLYQYFKSWRSFLAAGFVMSALFSFLAEPVLVWIGIYQMLHWKHTYSFPIYIIIAVLVKWLTELVLKIQTAHSRV
ncbi:hypothetical protein JCM39194_17720 [Desulfotomaculum varum]